MSELEYSREEKEFVRLFAQLCNLVKPGSSGTILKVFAEPSDLIKSAIGDILKAEPRWNARVRQSINRGRPTFPSRFLRLFARFMEIMEEYAGQGHTFKEVEQNVREELSNYLEEFFNSGEGIRWLSELVNRDSLSEYIPQVLKDLDYSEPDAIVNKATAVMWVSLFSTTADPNWPKLKAVTWLNIWGIDSKDPMEVAEKMIVILEELCNAGAASRPAVKRMLTHMMARLIANERGYDKGRTAEVIDKAVDAGLVHKGISYLDEDTGRHVSDVRDDSTSDFLDDLHHKELLQRLKALISDTKDLVALDVAELYARNKSSSYTFGDAFLDRHVACSSVGLRNPDAVLRRLQRLVHKYPAIRQLNPSA